MSSSKLPRSVWLLGWASFLTDTASEAIYPLLPLFLTGVLGAGAFSLGLIEGVADATGSVLRVLSGRLSDRWQVRKPLVLAGYSLSSALRPLMATVAAWPQVLTLRFADRVGKGIRGAPRDAMLAQIAATGLGALLASLIFGTIWELTGAPAAFACGAALAAGAAALLWIVAPSR